MRKWKQDYRSQLMQKSKEELGITLVELLAAISILSVVILLAGSIHMFGQRHFINQSESASQANDFSYAMTVMTTELRKRNPENVNVEENQILVNNNPTFYRDGTNLYHNGTIIAESVNSFTVNPLENGIEISIGSINQNSSNKDYHTTIYFRGEPSEQGESE